MTDRVFDLPEAALLRARAAGSEGAQWIEGLGEKIARLEKMWDLSIEGVLSGGSESLVLGVTRKDGLLAVLKLGMPWSADGAQEANVYRLANGQGYAELIAHDPELNALLLERLGSPLMELGFSAHERISTICQTLQTAWRPLSSPNGLMSGAEKAQLLADLIASNWRTQNDPCQQTTVGLAFHFLKERETAHATAACVLVHGDPHEYNTLQVPGTPNDASDFKFIDPDGLCAEPAYDLGIIMRGENEDLLSGDPLELGRQRCATLSQRTGIAYQAIWQWGFIERVSTGLHLLELDMTEEGLQTLAIADHWAAGSDGT